jgi:hypothetical protein
LGAERDTVIGGRETDRDRDRDRDRERERERWRAGGERDVK